MSGFGREQRGSHLDRNSHADETAGPVQDTPVAAPYGPDDLAKRGALANRASLGDGLAATLGGMSIASGPPSFAGPVIGPVDGGASNNTDASPVFLLDQTQRFIKSGAAVHMLAGAGHRLAGGFFDGGDFVLHHGGQVALDVAGFIPGVNVVTEGLQAGYHGLHAAYDASEGRSREASEETAEAVEHGAFALLNLTSGEAGNAAKGVGHAAEEGGVVDRVIESGEGFRSRMQKGLGMKKKMLLTADAVHKTHTAFDAAETGWDTAASVAQGLSGTHVPYLGGLVPWMLDPDEENE